MNAPPSYPKLKLGNKTPKTNPEKAQLFEESNFGIESHLFRKSHFDHINKSVEAHSYHFTPLDSFNDNLTDTEDESDLLADVDPDNVIRIVCCELENGKAPGFDISEVTKSQRNRRRQRGLQIFPKNSIFKAWKINIKQWIYQLKSCQII